MPVHPRHTPTYAATKAAPHPRSIDGFCQRAGICRASFYNQAKLGLMPDVLRIGSRVTITEEAEAEWKRRLSAPMNVAA